MTKNDSLELFWRPIVNQFLSGATVFPPFLGLEEADYFRLLNSLGISDQPAQHLLPGRVLRKELRVMRGDEWQQVFNLLQAHINPNLVQTVEHETELMCQLVSTACLGSAHLWSDIGMPERPRLSMLFAHYFPELHTLNCNNMRWKRFIYKQLCENGGDYVCRAPSCETCTSYHECFLPS